jgi:hypothetical protein
LATIKNTVKTEHKSTGSAKTVKDTQSVSKAQTRLGQASASAGRQFSAQANGLGGLVSAYAGAAANIFAITQAFSALSRAAQAEQTIQGTRQLAAEFGQSGDLILAKVQEITRGQLSIAESAQSVNIALSAGFNTDQIERLNKAALKTSIALGRNMTDALQRLTRGTAKVEPELLDELGIFVRLDRAVQQYAEKTGKAVGNLTQFERSQAFLNATLDQAETKFSAISTDVESPIASFERLSAQIADLGQQFGALLATALVPFADFISGNFANTLAAFGLLAGVIFAKLGSVTRQGLLSVTASVNTFTDSLVQRLSNAGAQSSAAMKALNAELDGLDLRTVRGSQGTQRAAREILKLGKETTLTTGQLVNLQSVLKAQKAKDMPGAAAALDKVNIALSRTGKLAIFAAKGFRLLGGAVGLAAKGFAGFLRVAGIVGLVISALELVSSAIAKIFGVDLFKEAGDAAKEFFANIGKNFQAERAAVSAATAVVRENTVEINKSTAALEKNLKARKALADSDDEKKNLEKLTKATGEETKRRLENVLRLTERFQKARKPSGFDKDTMKNLRDEIFGKTGKTFDMKTVDLASEEFRRAIVATYSKAVEKLGPETGRALEEVIIQSAQTVNEKKAARDLQPVIARILKEAGRGAEGASAFKFDRSGSFAEVLGIGKMDTDDILSMAQPLTNFVLNFKKLSEGFEQGGMKGNEFMTMLNGLKTSQKQLSDNFKEGDIRLTRINDQLAKAEIMANFVTGTESLTKSFLKMNSSLTSAGLALEKFFDVSSETPTLLFREEDIRANNLKLMEKQLKAIEGAKHATDLQNHTLTAIAGLYKKIANDTAKLEKSIEKQERKLANQLKILKAQNTITSSQNALRNLEKRNKLEEDRFKRQQSYNKMSDTIAKEELSLEQKKNALAEERLKIAQKEAEFKIESLERDVKAFEIQRNRQRDAAVAGLNQQQTVMGALPGFFTAKQGRQIEIQIAQENVNALQAIFDKEAESLAKFEKLQKESTNKQLEAIKLQVSAIEKDIAFQQRALEFANADAQNEITRAKERKAEFDKETTERENIAKKQEALTILQANIRKEEALAALDLQKMNIDMLAAEAEMLQKHPEALGKVMQAHAENLDKVMNKGAQQLTKADKDKFKLGTELNQSEVFEVLEGLQKRIGSRGDTTEGPTGLFGATQDIASEEIKRAGLVKKGKLEQLKLDRTIEKEKIDALIEEKNKIN